MPVNARLANESIQEINDNSWVIGERILLSRRRSPVSNSAWSDGKHFRGYIPATAISAFYKVKILDPEATREHVTLNYLRNKRPLSFATPYVHYHTEYDGRYYLVLSRLTGQTLAKAT